jgi:hypothetical protein
LAPTGWAIRYRSSCDSTGDTGVGVAVRLRALAHRNRQAGRCWTGNTSCKLGVAQGGAGCLEYAPTSLRPRACPSPAGCGGKCP